MGKASVLATGKTMNALQKNVDKLVRDADKKRLALDNMTEVTFNKETNMYEQGLHFSTSNWG